MRSIEFFNTAFADGDYGQGIRDDVVDMAKESSAIFAVSGDYYGARNSGLVIRNGNLYRDSMSDNDICILYADGTMKTFSPSEFSLDDAIAAGAYQSWTFGPKLLVNGMPARDFNSTVEGKNPRCAMGYYEPGHYAFVLVDGRQKGYSEGMTLTELAALFYSLGCKEAYNLDGGQSAMMVFMNELVNRPTGGGRKISDIIYIGQEAPQ
jgi:exopolysaccharide biosynthesis protein